LQKYNTLGLGIALIIILTHLNCVRNKAQGGVGWSLGGGGGRKNHTHYTHTYTPQKIFSNFSLFFKSRGVALFVCDVCGMRFEPPSLQEMYTASRYTLTLYLKQP